jgi:pimeloyl-ACP methyl ester carboxylesterase
VTFDRPGFGSSDRRQGRAVLDTAADVAALADGLRVDRFGVVGVSAGGGHALGCAMALGDRLSGVAAASMPGPLDEVPGAWDALDRRQRPAADMSREDPRRATRGVERYTQRWLDDPATFLGGGTPDDRALLADSDAGAMLRADVTEALRPGAAGMADDLVALWMPWGFRIADVPPGARLWHGAQDTRGEAPFHYLSATLPDCRAEVWPDAGHYGVLRHWPEVLRSVL